MLPVLVASAYADDACPQSFTEFDVRTLVHASSEALFKDDLLAHKRRYEEFVARVPCLVGQLPKDAWAELLVNEAIARHTRGGDWQAPLATALAIFPEYPDVPDFLMKEFSPPAPPKMREVPVPEDAALFVDGVLVPKVPVVSGEHVLQLWRDGAWQSRFVTSAQVPDEWLVPKPPKIVEVTVTPDVWKPAGRGAVGAGLGIALARQMVQDPGDFLGDERTYGALTTVASFGAQPIAASGGLFWDVALSTMAPTLRTGGTGFESKATLVPWVFAGPAAVLEDVVAGVGVGFVQIRKIEGTEAKGGGPVPVYYPQPHLVLSVRRDRADFEVDGGLTPSALHAQLRGGWLLGEAKPISWRLGFDTELGVAWLTAVAPDDRHASELQIGLLGRLDVAWGRDR